MLIDFSFQFCCTWWCVDVVGPSSFFRCFSRIASASLWWENNFISSITISILFSKLEFTFVCVVRVLNHHFVCPYFFLHFFSWLFHVPILFGFHLNHKNIKKMLMLHPTLIHSPNENCLVDCMNSKKAKSLLDAKKNDLDVNNTHKLKDYKFRAFWKHTMKKKRTTTIHCQHFNWKWDLHCGDVKMTKAIDKQKLISKKICSSQMRT